MHHMLDQGSDKFSFQGFYEHHSDEQRKHGLNADMFGAGSAVSTKSGLLRFWED